MQVSVVIPVYNAADYVQDAVESALAQPETAEVILVEDSSSDNSLEVCQKLAAAHERVHLYRHPDGKNHGAGATRNLAIRKSTCKYISFLDADDFFLPGRFSVAKALFEASPELEGVYEAVGMYIEDEAGAQRWDTVGYPRDELYTITGPVPPEQLFQALVAGGRGDLHLDGLIVKRTVFEKTGPFDEHLRLHQDTAIMWKMAPVARVVPGRLDEPVAMRRIHEANRISALRPQSDIYKTKIMFWETVWRWSTENLDKERQQLVLDRLLSHAAFLPRFERSLPRWARGLQKRIQLALLLFDYPALAREPSYWQCFVPNFRLLGRRLYNQLVPKSQA